MKIALYPVFSRRILLSSIAGFSVVYTALQAIRNPKGNLRGLSCTKQTFMSTVIQAPSNLGLFMVDFDMTCNLRDTCELFYQTSQNYRKASEEEKILLDQKWKGVTGKYLSEYFALISGSLGKYAVAEKYDENGLLSFLKEIADFNVAATKDVDDSRLITGADKVGLQWAAKKVMLHPGCLDLLKAVRSHVRVVSINWSAELIGYSFDNVIPEEHIFANKLLGNNGLSNGKVGKDMISSFDKLQIMKSLLAINKLPGVNVFVGDSITDLLCLLNADLGIIIGNSTALAKTASTFGIKITDLSTVLQKTDFSSHRNGGRKQSPTLFRTNSWFEIAELVAKLS